MQKWITSIAVFAYILCGCSTHDQCTKTSGQSLNLEALAKSLEQPPAFPYTPGFVSGYLRMTMSIQDSAGHKVLHCRLVNTHWKPLTLDRTWLPWLVPFYFSGTLLTAEGRSSNIRAGAISHLRAGPAPFLLAPNEIMEGNLELKNFPTDTMADTPIPTGQAVLLLWSYHLPTFGERPLRDIPKEDDQSVLQDAHWSGSRTFQWKR
jgi:hypothetical protein